MSNETFDEAGVLAKFDVRPDQVLDLLTLTGDTVDNVPGVAKVGPKTAAKWLAQYGSLDNLVAHAHEIPGVVGNNLREALPWLPQGRRLLTVKTDCELPVKPHDLAIARGGCRGAEIAVRAIRVQELAARHPGSEDGAARRGRRDRQARGHRRRGSSLGPQCGRCGRAARYPCAARRDALRDGARRDRARALARRDRSCRS